MSSSNMSMCILYKKYKQNLLLLLAVIDLSESSVLVYAKMLGASSKALPPAESAVLAPLCVLMRVMMRVMMRAVFHQ